MSHSLSKYVNYDSSPPQPSPPQPSPPQPQRSWPNYFNLSYQQPQSHHQYNQDVLTHRPANPFGRPPYPEQQQYSHANSPWINQNIPSNDDNNNEQIKKYFQIVFKCIFCKTIVSTVDDATVHLKDIHRIEQTTIDDDDFDDKTKEEEKSILVESKIDDDFSNKYDQKDCDDGDELTSSQNHFLHDDTDSDLYHERFNNTLSSFSIESENKLDNTIELSSDVEEIEETIVDDHQSAGTIFTLTNNNDDEGKTKKKLTTTIVELNEDFSNEYDQNIENEKSDDLFEATTKSKTTNDPFTKNNDNQKTIENFPNDESSSSSTNFPITRKKVNRKTILNFSSDESSSSSSIIESSEVEIVEDEDKTKKKLTTTITIVDENKNGNQRFKCPKCPKTFTYRHNLKRHSIRHSKKFPYHCGQCDKKFKTSSELKQHTVGHSDLRPYHCDQCDARFKRARYLKEHSFSHTDQRPYHCGQCDSRFKSRYNLKRHSLRHTIAFKFECGQCDKKFKTSSELKQHTVGHSDLRPYHCVQCDARFKRASSLKIHSFSHIKERPYCDNCNASCDQLKQLSSDGKDELPLICSVCKSEINLSIKITD